MIVVALLCGLPIFFGDNRYKQAKALDDYRKRIEDSDDGDKCCNIAGHDGALSILREIVGR